MPKTYVRPRKLLVPNSVLVANVFDMQCIIGWAPCLANTQEADVQKLINLTLGKRRFPSIFLRNLEIFLHISSSSLRNTETKTVETTTRRQLKEIQNK